MSALLGCGDDEKIDQTELMVSRSGRDSASSD
jgi:hypothetical protein